jgi:multisubunit Na+/H+ antiporter MnhC subunit
MRAPRNRVAILAAVVIGVAIVLFLIALLVIG